jgi:hypothetical protein
MEPTMPASAQPADRRVSPQRGVNLSSLGSAFGFTLWRHSTNERLTTVCAPGYFAFAIATGGIARGDAILVSADDGLMLCQVIVSPEGSLMLRPAANQLAVLP